MPRPALAQEQAHLDTMYERLDQVRDRARRRLDGVLLQPAGTRQAASERDAAADGYADQLARYEAAEADLCFGRLDLDDGEFLHVGRIGLFDVAEDDRPLLVDWRAPAARPFYVATAITRHGVVRRRYIRTRRRTVTGIDDDVLDSRLLAAGEDGVPGAGERPGGAGELADGLAGEAALLSALDAPRTGRMRDIVATIQAEQDHAIRSDLSGVVVVQGGPGTGKTAVALHRAAYLLFTHRELLARRGVLVLGPNATFLRYISQVLPSLAETGVVSWTVGQLFPGVDARVPEPDEAAAVKGHLDMAEVIAAAVRDRQEVPDGVVEVRVDDERLELDRVTCEQARDRARAASSLHNEGRPVFLAELTAALARQLALRIGYDPYGFDPLGENDAPQSDTVFDAADVAELARDLERNPAVVAVADRLWPHLTPQRLLADLWADPERIATAAPHLTERERHLLRRTITDLAHGWTASDVPLLDEAAELLGDVGGAGTAGGGGPAGGDRERRDRIEYAQGVLDVAAGSRSIDLDAGEGILQASDLLDARSLAERHAAIDRRSAAERAASDRRWTFGHVIVDEAQDVSPMAWRALMRRCPTRSMTLAGDLAQAGAPGSTTTWQQVLGPYVGDRWRLEELTLSYRTPAEIFALAAGVLTLVNPALRPPRAVRTGGARPWARRVAPAGLVAALADAIQRERAAAGEDGSDAGDGHDGGSAGLGTGFGGSVGVIVPAGAFDDLAPQLARAVPGLLAGDDPDLEAPVVLLTPRRAKGLEFDAVLVVEPARILADSVRGASDLYVALTRATKRLGLIHSDPLPADLDPSSFDLVGD